MHLAAQYGNLPFVKLLLAYGADINAVNDNRETPLGCALLKKRVEVATFLKENKGQEKWNQ